jgi:hypothetical protein
MSKIGENKICKKIDEMFEKYSANGTEKWILIAYFHQGDEDGGNGCYDYTGFGDIEDRVANRDDECKFLGNYKLDEKLIGTWQKPGPFRKDWDELTDMIWKSFERDIEDGKYESTNCYWFNYIFVTKDHLMFSCVESDFEDIKAEGRIADFNNYTEEQLDDGPDKQNLAYIEEHVKAIKPLLRELKSDKFKKEAADMIRGLLDKKEE